MTTPVTISFRKGTTLRIWERPINGLFPMQKIVVYPKPLDLREIRKEDMNYGNTWVLAAFQ